MATIVGTSYSISPTPYLSPGLTADVGTALLDRTREVARTICGRVRKALAPPNPLRVLCVDDQQDVADSFAAVLGMHGHDTRACYDGFSALHLWADFEPQACLIDLAMPGMDGLSLAAQLKKVTGPRALLLIAVTAWGTLEDRTRTALAGFHYHFVKPVDTNALLDALARFGRAVGGNAIE